MSPRPHIPGGPRGPATRDPFPVSEGARSHDQQ